MEVNRCFGCMEETLIYPCPHCGYDPQNRKHQDYALKLGTILHGKYLVGDVLGQGGFGITYIGLDLALDRKVAVKEYFPSAHVTRHTAVSNDIQWFSTEQALMAKGNGQEMFLKEARKMNRVASIPQVVQVRDLFQENETAYIVMDFIEGETLMTRLKRTGPMSWDVARKLFLPAIDAMEKVHKAGLIHRDISPDNLMIQLDGSVKILDLGAAKDLNINTGASSMQVAKGGFSPLEQYVQRGGSGTWTDVYSFAATIYYTLTGTLPPSAIDRMDNDTLRWDLPKLLAVPPGVLRALKKAMALRPKDRTQTLAEFAANLRDTSPVKAENASNSSKSSGSSKSSRMPVKLTDWLWLAAALALVVGGICLWLGREKPSTPQEPSSAQLQEDTKPRMPSSLTEAKWMDNVLMADPIPEDMRFDQELVPVFGSQICRYQILSVTFLDSVANAPGDRWDVSEAQDGSVLAWAVENGTVNAWMDDSRDIAESYDLYIAAKGGINGKNCENLFNGYMNATFVSFNGNFHTDYTQSMEYMFYGCFHLEQIDVETLKTSSVRSMNHMFSFSDIVSLDLSSFDTSNVENMAYMFKDCDKLISLDLSRFDTSKVTDMSDMFSSCSSLTQLDVSGFDTRNVTDMSFMFAYSDIEELDLSNFKTSNVVNMTYMFSNCEKLVSVDLRGFDTSSVTNMQGMFKECTSLRSVRGIESLDTSKVQYYEEFMDEGTLINDKPWVTLFE